MGIFDNLDKLNTKIENDNFYQFCIRHKKAINILQGIVVIGLLIGINIYVVKDYKIKQQIADHCGYTTSKYICICEKHYVEEWENLQLPGGNKLIYNLSSEDEDV